MIIDRPQYVNRIVRLLNHGMMLFLIGQRRVGKSFILQLVNNWIKEHRSDSNVVYINKELNEFGEIRGHEDLYRYVSPLLPTGAENYLLIDEVQDIDDYQLALRSLYAEQRCQIIATGSNAHVFSSNLATTLSGRYIEIPIQSLDYDEFLKFHSLEDNDSSLQKYLLYGGLPGLSNANIADPQWATDYLQGVYNTIILKDVVERANIRNSRFVSDLSTFIADNIGKPFSINSIVKYMKGVGIKITNEMVTNYLDTLKMALLIEEVTRFDIHGKELLSTLPKYYFADHGLRNYLAGFNLAQSIEKVMENAVFHHLKCLEYDIRVGALKAGEVDFVATKAGNRIYIQVCYLLASEETIERETGSLLKIDDNFPKYIVSMDPMASLTGNIKGIKHLYMRDFLMRREL